TPDQRHDDLAADDHDGNADDQPEDEEHETPLGGGGHGNDVVEAHHQVGDDDRPHRREHAVARLDLVLALVLLPDKLDADPDEKRSADQSDPRIDEEPHGEKGEHDAQHDRTQHAPEDAYAALPRREIAARERDHHGVVSGEENVDGDDFHHRHPERQRQ